MINYTWRLTGGGAWVLSNDEGADVANVYQLPHGVWQASPWGREIKNYPNAAEARAYIETHFPVQKLVAITLTLRQVCFLQQLCATDILRICENNQGPEWDDELEQIQAIEEAARTAMERAA